MPLARREPVRTTNQRIPPGRQSSTINRNVAYNKPNVVSHEGVRQSLQTHHSTTSTGSMDLDKLLGHGGLPLGNILLVEENNMTDFSSLLLRSYASQGICHARLDSASTDIIAVGVDEHWGRELPGVYKDKKQTNQEKINKETNEIDRMTSSSGTRSDMKIAWRYSQSSPQEPIRKEQGKPNYINTFDFTTRFVPSPKEIKYIPGPIDDLNNVAKSLEDMCSKAQGLVRIIIVGLLNPVIYAPHTTDQVISFMHRLNSLSRHYASSVTILISFSTVCYPRDEALTRWIELMSDGVIELDPQPHLFDTNSTESSNKPYQGFINIIKLPIFSEQGTMEVRYREHVFRAGKRQFEITEWGIPVDDVEPNPSGLDY